MIMTHNMMPATSDAWALRLPWVATPVLAAADLVKYLSKGD